MRQIKDEFPQSLAERLGWEVARRNDRRLALWWLDEHAVTFVVPVKADMAMTADSPAQAAVGRGITVDHRAHTVCHGQGKAAPRWEKGLARYPCIASLPGVLYGP